MKPDFKAGGFSSNVWSVNQSSPTRCPLCNHSKRLLLQTEPSCGLHENPLSEELTSAQHQRSRSSSRHVLQKRLSAAGFSPTLSLMLLQ